MRNQPITQFPMLPFQFNIQRILMGRSPILVKKMANITSLEAVLICNQLSKKEGLTPYYSLSKETEFIIRNVRLDVQEYVDGYFDGDILESVGYLANIQNSIESDKHSFGYRLPTYKEWQGFRKQYDNKMELRLPPIVLVHENLKSVDLANPLMSSKPPFFIARNY